MDATDEIQTRLTADIGLQDPADDVQNISYFISDGAANAGTSPIGSPYFEFVNDNSVDSYAVGIGSSLPTDLWISLALQDETAVPGLFHR